MFCDAALVVFGRNWDLLLDQLCIAEADVVYKMEASVRELFEPTKKCTKLAKLRSPTS